MTARSQGRRARRSRSDFHLLTELQRLREEIDADLGCLEEKKLEIALRLARIESGGMLGVAGYRSLTAYAREEHGLSPRATSEMRAVGLVCLKFPELLEAMRTKKVRWCSGYQVARLALAEKREAIGDLVELAGKLRYRALKRELNRLRPSHDRPLSDLDDRQVAWCDQAVAVARKHAGRKLSYKDALSLFCQLTLTGELDGAAAGKRPMFVLDVCAECKKTTRRTEEGPVPAAAEDVARACNDADVIDVRQGTGVIKRAVPAKNRRLVDARDHGMCIVPACGAPADDLHHLDGYEHGHDPKRCGSTCKPHHVQLHLGYLRIEGDMPGARFFLADGTYIGRAGDTERAAASRAQAGIEGQEPFGRPNTSGSVSGPTSNTVDQVNGRASTTAAQHPQEIEAQDPQAISDAIQAVVVMGIPRRKAEEWVTRMLKSAPGRIWTGSELVQELLIASP